MVNAGNQSVRQRDRDEQDLPRFLDGVCKCGNCQGDSVPCLRPRYTRRGVRRERSGSETRLTLSASLVWSPSCRREHSKWGEFGVLLDDSGMWVDSRSRPTPCDGFGLVPGVNGNRLYSSFPGSTREAGRKFLYNLRKHKRKCERLTRCLRIKPTLVSFRIETSLAVSGRRGRPTLTPPKLRLRTSVLSVRRNTRKVEIKLTSTSRSLSRWGSNHERTAP